MKDGVDESTAVKLIDKLKNGENWDSMKPEYKYLKPEIEMDNYTKTIYPDGSYIIESIEEVPSYSSKSIHIVRHVKVSKYTGIVNMSFYADYKRDTSSGKAMIMSQYAYNTQVFAGTYQEDTKGYVTGWANPTNAWYAINVNINQAGFNIYNGRLWIKLFANGYRHWTVDNFPV